MLRVYLAAAALMLALYLLIAVLSYRDDRAGGVPRRAALVNALLWPADFVRFVMGSWS